MDIHEPIDRVVMHRNMWLLRDPGHDCARKFDTKMKDKHDENVQI